MQAAQNSSSELKKLQTELTRITKELNQVRADIRDLSSKAEKLELYKEDLLRSMKELKKVKKLVVSEHALLRYLERVKGMDLEAVKQEMIPECVVGLVAALGNGNFPVESPTEKTFTIRVEDGVVTTIVV